MVKVIPRVLSSSLLVLVTLLAPFANTQQSITLTGAERLPYLSPNLPHQGYVAEIASLAFEKMGYQLSIDYYPLARAAKLAEEGKVAGMLPVYRSEENAKNFWLSQGLAGDQVGLLKKKSFPGTILINPSHSLRENLSGLRDFHFSIVRGGSMAQEFAGLEFLRKQYVLSDLHNLDMLAIDRMDFAVIDKFSASDLLVTARPHLIGQLEFVQPPLFSRQFHVAFSKRYPNARELFVRFDAALKGIIDSGVAQNIMAKHGFFKSKEKPPKHRVKLVIGAVNNEDMLTLEKMSHSFEASHPDIELQWRIMDEGTLRQRLLSDLAISDGQFDVMTIGAYETPIWAENGWLTPIQKLPLDYALDDLVPSVKQTLSFNNKLYALPFDAETSVLFYRPDLFDQAGLTMPPQPTYQQVLSFAETLHTPEKQIYGICLRGKPGWGENVALLSTMVNTFGGRWFDENWEPQLQSVHWSKAISMYTQLLINYGPPRPNTLGYKENLQLFSQGHCAMWIDASVATGALFNPQQSKVSDKFALSRAPIGTTDKGAEWLWVWALAVPESSRHKEQALQFAAWATSQTYINAVIKSLGPYSAPAGTRYSTYAQDEYLKHIPFAESILQAIETADRENATLLPSPTNGIQYIAIPEFPAIGGQVALLLEQVLLNKITIQQATKDAQKRIRRQMAASGYYTKDK